MDDLVKQAIEDMREQVAHHKWPHRKEGGSGGANTLTGCIKSDGVKVSQVYPCHNPITTFNDAVVLWSAVTHRSSKEASTAYFKWLLKESPWAINGIVPDLDFEFMFNEGFVFTNLNKTPGNLLHNFLIATRMTAEWGNSINDWYELVYQHNIEPNFAFLFLTCYATTNNSDSVLNSPKLFLSFTDKYDWPLDMARASEEYVLNFLTANAVGVSPVMYYPSANTRPINLLWGNPLKIKDKSRYVETLKELYESEFATKEKISTRRFTGNEIQYSVMYKKGSFLQIIKREQERIFDILNQRRAA